MTGRSRLLLPAVGAVLVLAGLATLNANPPLPPAFGGSFHGNIKALSALADEVAMVAVVVGCALLVLATLRSAQRKGPSPEAPGPTAGPTSPGPSTRSPKSG